MPMNRVQVNLRLSPNLHRRLSQAVLARRPRISRNRAICEAVELWLGVEGAKAEMEREGLRPGPRIDSPIIWRTRNAGPAQEG